MVEKIDMESISLTLDSPMRTEKYSKKRNRENDNSETGAMKESSMKTVENSKKEKEGEIKIETVNSQTTNVIIINCVEGCKEDVSLLKTAFDSLAYRCTVLNVGSFKEFKSAIHNQERNEYEISMVFMCVYGSDVSHFFLGLDYVDRSTLYTHLNQLKRDERDVLLLFANVFYRPTTKKHTFVEEEDMFVVNFNSLYMLTYSSPRDGSHLVKFLLRDRNPTTPNCLSNEMTRIYFDRKEEEGVGVHKTLFHSIGSCRDILVPSFKSVNETGNKKDKNKHYKKKRKER